MAWFKAFLDWRFFFGIGLGLFIGSMVILRGPVSVTEPGPVAPSGPEEIVAKAREMGMVGKDVYDSSVERIKALETEIQQLKTIQVQAQTQDQPVESEAVTIIIPEGINSEEIMSRLINAGVQIDPAEFEREVERRGVGSRFKKGTFTIGKRDSLDVILSKLTR